MQSATLQQGIDGETPQELRRVVYSYYQDGQLGGGNGDLRLVAHQLPDGSGGWEDHQYEYYRYQTEGSRLLKYLLGDRAYRRLAQAADPDSADDETVAVYADRAYEYDLQKRVVAASGADGRHETTASYFYRNAPGDTDYNHWYCKTLLSHADGSQTILYINFAGHTILKDFRFGAMSWKEYQYYNARGRRVLRAGPDAVEDYDDTYADLGGPDFVLKAAEGLVQLTDYYTATTAAESRKGDRRAY